MRVRTIGYVGLSLGVLKIMIVRKCRKCGVAVFAGVNSVRKSL